MTKGIIYLGFGYESFNGLKEKLGVDLKELADNQQTFDEKPELLDEIKLNLDEQLEAVTLSLVSQMGFTFLEKERIGWLKINTPVGKRTIDPLRIDLFLERDLWDDWEENQENAVFGVQLTSEMSSLLDWKEIFPGKVIFNQETNKTIELIKKEISRVLPIMDEATIIVR